MFFVRTKVFLQVAETRPQWLNQIGFSHLICFVFHGPWNLEVENPNLACRPYYVMNEEHAFYLSALPFLECDLHPKVASWVQSGCCLSRLTSID